MIVERVSVDKVKSTLAGLKNRGKAKKAESQAKVQTLEEIQARLDREEAERKEKPSFKKRRKLEKTAEEPGEEERGEVRH